MAWLLKGHCKYSILGIRRVENFGLNFEAYGHEKLSLIDGGFDEWKRKGHEISKDDVKLKPGTWTPKADNFNKYFIKFEQLEEQHGDRRSKKLYLSGHIPQAPHVCMDVATYPSQYERYAPSPPDFFQEYMRDHCSLQLIGVDPDEHLILYSRGRFGGMKHCSKMAWLLK
ncbi:hypothetical protein ANCDUO_19224, partial [Ancylostoma duodenale]